MSTRCFFPARRTVVLIGSVMLTILILGTWPAQAQTTGTIYGRVSDSSGAAIRGATVTVKHKETSLTRTLTTNDEGDYTFTLLPVGDYTIRVNAQGFKPFEQNGLGLQVTT